MGCSQERGARAIRLRFCCSGFRLLGTGFCLGFRLLFRVCARSQCGLSGVWTPFHPSALGFRCTRIPTRAHSMTHIQILSLSLSLSLSLFLFLSLSLSLSLCFSVRVCTDLKRRGADQDREGGLQGGGRVRGHGRVTAGRHCCRRSH